MVNFLLGRPAKALADLNRAVALDPDDAEARTNRGSIHYTADRLDEAGADFDRAIELDPDHRPAYDNRAKLRKYVRDYAGAEKDYGEAIQLKATLIRNKKAHAAMLGGNFTKWPGFLRKSNHYHCSTTKNGRLRQSSRYGFRVAFTIP